MMLNPTLFVKDVTVCSPDIKSTWVKADHQHVAVFNGHFLYVGDDAVACMEALRSVTVDEPITISGDKRWMIPGLANTHTHMGMSLFRNASDDTSLQTWLNQVIFPREAQLTPEDVYWGNLLSSLEMISSGTTLAADMYFFPSTALQTAEESGLRLMIAVDPFVKRSERKGKDTSFDYRPDLLTDVTSEVKRRRLDTVQVNLQMHSLYLYPESYYKHYRDLAGNYGLTIQTHIAETKWEEETLIKKYGKRPAELAELWGLLDVPLIAAHGVYLNESDRYIYRNHETVLSHNPASNMKLASGIADIQAATDAGVRVTLGTDGAASNNSLDMYKEMYLAALCAKARSMNAESMGAGHTLRMATLDGYGAFGINGGAIRRGMVADFQLMDCDDARFINDCDPAAVLVYTLPRDLVRTVVINGRILYHNNEYSFLDAEKIRYHAGKCASRLINVDKHL